MFPVMLFLACNEQEKSQVIPEEAGESSVLSVNISAPEIETRVEGAPNSSDEKRIYSLAVLVFRKDGTLDGYGKTDRTVTTTAAKGLSKKYSASYTEIDEIRDIDITTGTRDVYIIANAPDGYFDRVSSIDDLYGLQESLTNQGSNYFRSLNNEQLEGSENPNSGAGLPDWETNLTMYAHVKDVVFEPDESAKHFFLGYTGTTDGIPSHALSTETNKAPLGNAPVELERLVARVAINQIMFDLKEELEFEGFGSYASAAVEYELDSIFVLNAKLQSRISTEADEPSGSFGYGDQDGYNALRSVINVASSSYSPWLGEQIVYDFYGNYDITDNSTPLWFYLFENIAQKGSYPTYFVIGVKYRFRDADRNVQQMTYYYPVVINSSSSTGEADNSIQRNSQYGLYVTITGLGVARGAVTTRSTAWDMDNLPVKVYVEKGSNLFPWTGNVYK